MYICRRKSRVINQTIVSEGKTYFAPAVRTTKEQILKDYELVGSQKFFTDLFGAVTGIGAVIDKNRQIVYSNDDFLNLLGFKSLEQVLGKRLGELISCIHAGDNSSGCGTSVACAYCGAVNAILECQKTGVKSEKETRITTLVEGNLRSWDLNIISTPVILSGKQFYLLIIQDISDEKRRSALERIFFHDLLNRASGLNGLLSILKEGIAPDKARELIDLSEEATRDIIDEITMQRQIRAAENGDLQVNTEQVNSIELTNSAIRKISFHEVGQNKHIIVSDNSANLDFETDKALFQRVIINLCKNALEETPRDGSVIIGIENCGDNIKFRVKNDQVMSEEIQRQLFQRSFSTKGIGRGLGTYSIRLITENYLKGKVSFISNETDGTVFSIELSKKFPSDLIKMR